MPITAQVGGILTNFMKFEEIPDFNQTRAVADQRSIFIGPRQSHFDECFIIFGVFFRYIFRYVTFFVAPRFYERRKP